MGNSLCFFFLSFLLHTRLASEITTFLTSKSTMRIRYTFHVNQITFAFYKRKFITLFNLVLSVETIAHTHTLCLTVTNTTSTLTQLSIPFGLFCLFYNMHINKRLKTITITYNITPMLERAHSHAWCIAAIWFQHSMYDSVGSINPSQVSWNLLIA